NPYTAAQILTLQHQLNKCLGPEFVTQRPGAGGQKVSYVESFKAIQLANEIFGFNGWSSSIRAIHQDFAHEINGRWSMGISVTMRVTLQDGTYHEDIGYGSIENTKGLAGAYEKCKKEGTTDGLKRCLRNFGNVLGNCVYDKEYLARLKRVKENPV
ncbi:Rad52/22 double-strand break repair protein, partial [Saitoella complicata NRRL Y-17804]